MAFFIVSPSSAKEKFTALQKAGVHIAQSPAELGLTIKKATGW
ncbi:MAG: hypothetical protein QM538_02485 [Methylacidiphilales bacterium]|nr:hypothetical protein [Candidatus Methylacidiphilales bacterium]